MGVKASSERQISLGLPEAPLMKRCDQCGGRFGLIRYRHYTFRFCSETCTKAWKRYQYERARRQRFLQWLRQPGDARSLLADT